MTERLKPGQTQLEMGVGYREDVIGRQREHTINPVNQRQMDRRFRGQPRIAWLNAASVLVCLMAGILLAQNPTATLLGTVRDTSRAVVTGAALEVRNTDTGDIRKTMSGRTGDFTIPNLAPGPYEVTISKAGFRNVRETSIVLQMDQIARMQFQLEVGAVSQSVEVIAFTAPLINTDNGAKGEVMTANEIVEMPLNGRSINDLALLAAGVIPNTTNIQGSAFAINGARPDNTNFVIEGFGVADLVQGGSLLTPVLSPGRQMQFGARLSF